MRQTCSPAVPNKSGPEAPKFEALETVLLILFPYMSWMLAEAMKLSGIVSILFCVIIMAHYTTRNLYPKTQAFRCASPIYQRPYWRVRRVHPLHGGPTLTVAGSGRHQEVLLGLRLRLRILRLRLHGTRYVHGPDHAGALKRSSQPQSGRWRVATGWGGRPPGATDRGFRGLTCTPWASS